MIIRIWYRLQIRLVKRLLKAAEGNVFVAMFDR
jgi:hypothetical protein